ncbi:hypothetical protein P6N53_16360 [Desulforamulus aquiferis]|uniref:ATP-dependent DNA ligase family profile domain-containing protein n=2 Tax=Desulforamulus aquiferis TaxID=1397668 RepID=A0AAW7ZHL5_9FIRM|nr:hypothetical protein [Desulforamulus aquiferis]
MLLEKVEIPFNSDDHIFEWKVDGVRCIMHYSQGNVRLQSKTGRECTAAFPELHNPLLNAKEAILDGEITVLTNGKPDFEGVMSRYLARPGRTSSLVEKRPAFYVVWDILWHDNQNLTGLPLLERKEILAGALEDSEHITKIDWIDGRGQLLWEAVTGNDLEGMVAKKKNSRYEHRRSSNWVKIKDYKEIVVNVLGYKPKDGYVLVGTDDRVQGHALGINKTERAALWEILSRYGKEDGLTIWLPKGIRGRVKFTTWTPAGNMRDCYWARFEV